MSTIYGIKYLDPVTEKICVREGFPVLTVPNAEKAMGDFEFMLRTYGTDILFFKATDGEIYLIPKKNIISVRYEPYLMPGE